jgi:hypothetical protein
MKGGKPAKGRLRLQRTRMCEMAWQHVAETAGWTELRRGPMPAFLVRLIKNRDIVGFFTAEDFDSLMVAVDECTDVDGCEFVELPPGGIMWTSPAIPVPIDPGDPDDEETELEKLPWAKAELSECWWSVIYGYTDEEWTAFDPEAAEDPDPPQRPIGPARVVPLRPRRGAGRR